MLAKIRFKVARFYILCRILGQAILNKLDEYEDDVNGRWGYLPISFMIQILVESHEFGWCAPPPNARKAVKNKYQQITC